ncbi:MAG: exonuclease domain-containing protein [Syntrophotaleaceae bacterium]
MSVLSERLVFLDLETTGANPHHDRILEIGLCQVVGDEVTEEWATLVNPQRPFSPFIEQLTGISPAMVFEAPIFAEIADELRGKLSGKVLVAHNARFDYAFLKNEFRRLEITFQEKTLCTVKLSRALFPQHTRHNLDSLIERHGLARADRHRALGDARVIREFFSRLRADLPGDVLDQAVQKQLKTPSHPPHLAAEQIEGLPRGPGVYLFYGENDVVLYVGKSIDIRSRVRSHFSGDHREYKGMRLSQQVRRIDWIETAGELGALLLEARLVKELSPIHNRRLRRTRELFTLRLPGDDGKPLPPDISPLDQVSGAGTERLFGMFRSRREAEKTLRAMASDHGLCHRLLGLERGKGACFGYQIKQCRGACVGKEPPQMHQLRLVQALYDLKLRSWPFPGAIGIREQSPDGDRTDIHVFDNWRHLGTARNEGDLQDLLRGVETLPFDRDGYKILTRYLDRPESRLQLLDLAPFSASLP